MNKTDKKSKTRDMTVGSIPMHLILFSLPLLLGNIFQLLYNTVDTWVVGNYVSTQALAAVGSTTPIINIMVFFFNGLSIGAGVVIARNYGAKDFDSLHISIETTMAMTFILSVIFSIIGVLFVTPMLHLISTPEDVIQDASLYLRIYFSGITGLMVYNMASGVLRAVGDTQRPLYFLIFTSLLNIVLDLTFVIVFHMGIAGVGFATVISQIISGVGVIVLLSRTNDVYKLTWNDCRIQVPMLKQILSIGLPTAIQSMITSFSNAFVQSYINAFGSSCVAGWSCYGKLDQFAFLPMSSLANAATTFVGQNMGAEKEDRADKGTIVSIIMTVSITLFICVTLFTFANQATAIFSKDSSVIQFGVMFLRTNIFFLCFNCINHVLAGALRGRGDSKGPMVIMITSFVVLRQIYLFIMTHFISNTPTLVGLGYPLGWLFCCIIEVNYFYFRYKKKAF